MLKYISKKWKSFLAGFIALFVSAVLAAQIDLPQEIPDHLQLKAPKEKILNSRIIGDDVIYLYISDKEIKNNKYKGLDEDVSKRTHSSKHFQKSNDKMLAVIYGGSPFYKDEAENKWYQTETATTTEEAFDKQTISFWDNILRKEVFAIATTTYSEAGDGYILYSGSGSWDTTHDAETGTGVDAVQQGDYLPGTADYVSGYGYFKIYRAFLPFDTSGLPDDAVISSSTVCIDYYQNRLAMDNDAQAYFTVIQTSQPDTSTLTTADFDALTFTEGIDTANRQRIEDICLTQYTCWDLNATGRGWIDKTGYTKLGLVEGHDFEDLETDGTNVENTCYAHLSEYTGTADDPKLEIVYSEAAVAEEAPQQSIIWFY